MSELRRPTQPDPLDNLLNRFIREADLETKGLYASIWRRAVARVVDTIVVMTVAYAIYYSFIGFVRSDNTINVEYIISRLRDAVPALALMIWVLVYSPLMEATGGTLGKRLMRIGLVDAKTLSTPYFRYCMARTWLYLVISILSLFPTVLVNEQSLSGLLPVEIATFVNTALIMLIPAAVCSITVFTSPNRAALHDKLTGMIVLKRK